MAFSVAEDDYAILSERVTAACEIWRDDRSEGSSTYFLDPDGHKLEIHVCDLATRLAHYRQGRPEGMRKLD